MDRFAVRADRADFFRETANRMGLPAALVIEKDFWVCWTLRQVFALEGQPRVIFKGGTSLSKCYGAIQRFSEDIDLAFDRAELGLMDDQLPGASRKARERLLADLGQRCAELVSGAYRESLSQRFAGVLGADGWSVAVDPNDDQTLIFQYPPSLAAADYSRIAYVRPVVRIELGARSDHQPAETKVVTPYVADFFAGEFECAHCEVRTLAAERTFWEKAVILHAEAHRTASREPSAERLSRHYYDTAMLWRSHGKKAMERVDLLDVVARHKTDFFPAAWASYATAMRGSLKLVPPSDRASSLERDYGKMAEMLFGDAPSFEEILATLREIEDEVNHADRSG